MARHFDKKSTERIADVVRKVENDGINNFSRPDSPVGPCRLLWFLLIEDFDENREALGIPGNWAASADNEGDGTGTPVAGGGFLTADSVARYTVRDTTGTIGARNGSWVACQWLGTENGSVWEPVSSSGGFDRVSGQATGDVTGGSFTIDNISLIAGTDPRDDDSSSAETLSVSNPFGFTIDDNGRVHAEYSKTTKTWIAYQAACPAP